MFKKYGPLACLSIISSAFAGGPSPMAMPAPEPAATPFYLEGNVGMAWQDWKAQESSLLGSSIITGLPSSPSLNVATWENGNSRFMYGVDAGWQMFPSLAIEGGFYSFSDVTVSAKSYTTTPPGLDHFDVNGKIASWLAYIGVRLTAFENHSHTFRVFAKLAAAYSNNTYDWTLTTYGSTSSTATTGNAKNHFWTGLAALGAQYDLNQNFYLGIQGLYVFGNESGDFKVPALFGAVGTIGFRF